MSSNHNRASPKSRHDEKNPVHCFFRISIGGEVQKQEIVIALDVSDCPKTCDSFLSLCRDDVSNGKTVTRKSSPQPTYRGCEFHRVVPGLCVQTGDWERFDGTGGYSPVFGRNWKDEAAPSGTANTNKSIINKHDSEGIVSMANAGKPNTNGSQWFITLKATPHLDGKHTVFGKVVSGMNTVKSMVDVEREGDKGRPVSLQRIVIEDCGRCDWQQQQQQHRSTKISKRHKKEKKSIEKKKKKKRHRRHRNSSGSSSNSSSSSSDDDSAGDESDDSDSERRSKKHKEKRRRKKSHKKRSRRRVEDDESSNSTSKYNSDDSRSISSDDRDRKRKKRRYRDEKSRSSKKKKKKR